MYVVFETGYSGGNWYIDDEGWKALEAAGWQVDWKIQPTEARPRFIPDEQGNWPSPLAKTATRRGLDVRAAVEEWECVTGGCATERGCACCSGQPHYFTLFEDDGTKLCVVPESEWSGSHWYPPILPWAPRATPLAVPSPSADYGPEPKDPAALAQAYYAKRSAYRGAYYRTKRYVRCYFNRDPRDGGDVEFTAWSCFVEVRRPDARSFAEFETHVLLVLFDRVIAVSPFVPPRWLNYHEVP